MLVLLFLKNCCESHPGNSEMISYTEILPKMIIGVFCSNCKAIFPFCCKVIYEKFHYFCLLVCFWQFLDRCTEALSLPFAARRMFNEDGKELSTLSGLGRDQLVYVSCGDAWNDPKLSYSEQQRRAILTNLASDIAHIRHFCALRDPQGDNYELFCLRRLHSSVDYLSLCSFSYL